MLRPGRRVVHAAQRPCLKRAAATGADVLQPAVSQSCTVLYQNSEFCGFRTQWFSSGNQTKRLGTPRRCSAVKAESPSQSVRRKSLAEWITSCGVRQFWT